MSYLHKNLAGGNFDKLNFVQKMANIGSELERVIRWRDKNSLYAKEAFERCLELLDFTIKKEKEFCRLKELLRIREGIADYFYGENQYSFSDDFWKKYFYHFNYAAQISK